MSRTALPAASRRRSARRTGTTLTLVTAFAVGTSLVRAVVLPDIARADPPPPPPTSVSLSTTLSTLGSQDTATLTATAGSSVSLTGYTIVIADVTTGMVGISCSSGTTCSMNRTFNNLADIAHDYVAYVATSGYAYPASGVTATSNTVTLNPVSWSVTLTTTRDVVGSQESTTITATANQSVSNTGKTIVIADVTAGAVGISCGTTTTCSMNRSFNNLAGTARNYVAYVATSGYAYPVSGIAATSNSVSVTPAAWSVTLTTSRSVVGSQESTTITATSNQSVSNTGKTIVIADVTAGAVGISCGTGTSCSMNRSFNNLAGTARNYVAYVATSGYAYPVSGIAATSNTVDVTPLAWSVTLTASKTVLGSQDSSTITATANQSVSGTGKTIIIADLTAGTIGISCGTTTTCSMNRTFNNLGATARNYVAYVATSGYTYPASGIAATSNGVTLTPVAWSATLTATDTVLESQESSVITATANQSLTGTGKSLYLYDTTTGTLAVGCNTGTTCSITRTYNNLANTPRSYIAYIAPSGTNVYPPPGILATSNTVTVSPAALVITLTTNRTETTATTPSALLTAALNYPLPTGYSFSIYDDTGVNRYCTSVTGSTFQLSVTPPTDTSRVYTAFVSQSCPSTGTAGGTVLAEDSVGVTHSDPGGASIALSVGTWQVDPVSGNVTYAISATASRLAASDGPCSTISCTWMVAGYLTDPQTSTRTLVHSFAGGTLAQGTMALAETLGAQGADLPAMDTVELAVYSSAAYLDDETGVAGTIVEGVSIEEFLALLATTGTTKEVLCLEVASAPQPRPNTSLGMFGEMCEASGTTIQAMMVIAAAMGGSAILYWVFSHYYADPTQPHPAPTEPPTTSPPSGWVVDTPVVPQLEPMVEKVVATWLTMKRVRSTTSVDTLKKAARRCLDQVSRSMVLNALWQSTGTNPCETLPIYFPGADLGEATTHRAEAIYLDNPDWASLTYEKRSIKSKHVSTSWYSGEPECAGALTGQHCDEFPNFSTVEGGPEKPGVHPRASLRLIPGTDNTLEGSRYGGFVSSCALDSAVNDTGFGGGDTFLVVPLPVESNLPTGWICPIEVP